jgi:hypothetical protein
MPAPHPAEFRLSSVVRVIPGARALRGEAQTGFKLARGQVVTRASDSRNPGPGPALRARATNDSGSAGISRARRALSRARGIFLGPATAALGPAGFVLGPRRALLSGRERRIHAPKLSLSAAKPAPVKITGISRVDSERTSGLLLILPRRDLVLSGPARVRGGARLLGSRARATRTDSARAGPLGVAVVYRQSSGFAGLESAESPLVRSWIRGCGRKSAG